MKSLFSHPNQENKYQFCFGSDQVKQTLEFYNKVQGDLDERIESTAGRSNIVPVVKAMDAIRADVERNKAKTLLQQDAMSGRKSKRRNQGEEEVEAEEETPLQDGFDFDPPENEVQTNIRRLASIEGNENQTLVIQTEGQIVTVSGKTDTHIFAQETPPKRPPRHKNKPKAKEFDASSENGSEDGKNNQKRNLNWTDGQKFELAKLFIDKANHIAPFETQKGKANPIKTDMKKIHQECSIGGKLLTSLMKDHNTLAKYMTGEAKGFTKQSKGEGIIHIIHKVMAKEYPAYHSSAWTPEMMREIKDEILEEMKKFM